MSLNDEQRVGPPDFVIAGAGRAGTTVVTETLRRHPDVFFTQPKEPNYLAFGENFEPFYGPGDDVTVNRVTVKSLRDYLALYKSAGARLRGEGSVSTLYYRHSAADTLYRINPHAKVIIMLREPVARAYSAHQYLLAKGWEPEPSFAAALDDEDRRVRSRWHHIWHYRRMSTYAEATQAFLARFGPAQVGVWFYEDFVAQPQDTLIEICRFLSVSPVVASSAPVQVNGSGQARSQVAHRAMHAASANAVTRSLIRTVTPFRLRERIRQANLRKALLPDDARRRLDGVFDADREQLEQLLGRHIPWSS